MFDGDPMDREIIYREIEGYTVAGVYFDYVSNYEIRIVVKYQAK